MRPLRLFCSYSHKDDSLRQALQSHLAVLKRRGIIADWHDRRIGAGTEWRNQIDKNLELAQVILLLISADFLASDYCYESELSRAIQRHENGEARVIPVIARPCDWTNAPFHLLQALPNDAKPVTAWHNQDEAWRDVATGIRLACEDIRASQGPGISLYCEKPSAATLLVWPTCEIRRADNMEVLRGNVELAWGRTTTIPLEAGVEYEISVCSRVPLGTSVGFAKTVLTAHEQEVMPYMYKVLEGEGYGQQEVYRHAQLVQVMYL